jgi:hypothetical protein
MFRQLSIGRDQGMMFRGALATLLVGLAFSVVAAPPAGAAASHWTRHQAGRHYLRDVRASNRELDRWDGLLAAKHHRLHALTNEARRVAQSEMVLVQRLIRGNWSAKVDKLIKHLEVRLLDEVSRWEDVAAARTAHRFHAAIALLPSRSGAANRVRRALGLPSVS